MVRKKLWWIILIILNISFTSYNLILFYLMFELRLIPILIIILYYGNQPERLSAGLYFLMYTSVMSFPYLVIVLLLVPEILSFCYYKIYVIRVVFRFLLIIPFLVKIPVFRLHFWLPKAHVEASTSGSIILAGLLLKLGSYGIIRIAQFSTLRICSRLWLLLSLVSSYLTFLQSDTKKFIAFRRITHITFIILALITPLKTALIRVLILSLAHGWTARGIFITAGSFRHSVQTRLSVFRKSISFRWFKLVFGILLIVNASVPPMPSFYPEVFIVLRLVIVNYRGVLIFILLSFFVCYYNTYLFISFTLCKHVAVNAHSIMKSSNTEYVSCCITALYNILSLFYLRAL
jgi:NADH-ubiquinone oxidoreductase chain 4